MDSTLEGKLLMGLDIEVEGLYIKNYKLKEIFNDIGLENYYKKLQPAILKVKDLNLEDIIGEEQAKDKTMYDAVCMFVDIREMYLKFLNTFTHHKWEFNDVFNEFVVWRKDETPIRLGRNKIDNVFGIVKEMYCLNKRDDTSDKLTPINDEVAQALKEFQEWEDSLPQKNSEITLNSIIEGLSVKSEYSLFNIWDLTVYQLMRTFYKVNDAEHIDNITKAVYAGTVDGKAIKDLHWAKRSDA